jgi:hypothetical protein
MVAVQEMVKEHVDRVPLEPADTDVTFLVVHWEGHIWLHKYIAKHVELFKFYFIMEDEAN